MLVYQRVDLPIEFPLSCRQRWSDASGNPSSLQVGKEKLEEIQFIQVNANHGILQIPPK